MRHFVTRPALLLTTFALGLALVLLYGGLVGRSVKRLARRAAERVAAPHVADAERRHRDRRILLDLREYWEVPSSERPRSFDGEDAAFYKEKAEAGRRIFPKLFPKGYLEHVADCSRESRERPAASAADLAWARERGQFDPSVYDNWQRGSFTEPGAHETLYHVSLRECNALSSSGPPSTEMFAVFDRWDGLHASFDSPGGESVYVVRDVDADGVDEVLLSRGEMRGTKGVFSLRLVSLRGGRLRVLHDFGVGYVYSYEQSFFGDERVITIPVIYYTPRGDRELPSFEVDFYRGFCSRGEGCDSLPRPGRWRYFKSGRLEEGDY
jgi:hypothetical protein